MDKILRSTAGQVTLTLYDQNGAPLTASAVSVSVKDAAGVVVITSTPAIDVPLVDGVWGLELSPTHTAQLGVYTATWLATVVGVVNTYTTQFEVVGAFLFTIAEARAFDDAKLASLTEYPTAELVDARTYVEDYIEHLTGTSFVPRRKRLVLDAVWAPYVRLPDLNVTAIVSASLGTEVLDVSTLRLRPDLARVFLTGGTWWTGENLNAVAITYDYGMVTPPPAIKRAALMLLADKVVGSNVDARALTFSDDLGTRSLAVPGRSGPTGLPEVDAVIGQYAERLAVLH